jgi:ribosome-associated protein
MKAKAPKKIAKAAPKAKPSHRLVKLIVAALDEKKAEDLRVLDVSKASSITDYLVLATGGSEPHLRALRVELERVLDQEKARILGVDTTKGSGWTVVDAFEVMIHLFTPENRGKYRMEQLWKDAVDVEVAKLLR